MKKLLFLGIAVFFTVISCKEFAEELHQNSNNAAEIAFNANIGKYTIKATNTSFEENDAVAILAAEPINSGFVKYVVKDGSFTSDTPICWKEGMADDERVFFALVYPFDPNLTTWDVNGQPYYEVGVNADQSTHSLYTASDFMIGEAQGAPSDGQVQIQVNHEFSQVHISITNKSDKVIKDVYLSEVYGKGVWNWDIDFSVKGEKGTIKACPLTASGTQDFVLILPPQTAQPQLIITTTSDEQITFTLPSEVEFKAGHKSKANVVVDETSSVSSFTTVISDWTPDNDLQFGNEGQSTQWEYIGMGKYMDDVFPSLFNLNHFEMDVEYYRDKANPDRIMIKDPYKNWPYLHSPNFEFLEGRQIILNITKDGERYIESGSSTGISINYTNYGELFITYYCSENGWGNPQDNTYLTEYHENCWSAYYSITEEYKYSIIATFQEGESYVANINGMTIFTLPGGIRRPVFVKSTKPDYNKEYNYFKVLAGHDLTRFGVAYIPYDQIITDALLDSITVGSAKNQLIFEANKTPGEWSYDQSNVFEKTGAYKIISCGDCTYDNGYYDYATYSDIIPFVAPGDEAPACKPEIVSCTLNVNDQRCIDLKFKVDYYSEDYLVTLPKSEFDSLNISEDRYSEFFKKDYRLYLNCPNVKYSTGQATFTRPSLEPNTEYVVLYLAKNMFGNTGYTMTTITTGGELEFVSLGMGKIYDYSAVVFFADEREYYCSDVEIMQEISGKPIYRVMDPYKQLHEEAPELDGAAIIGSSTSFIQFFTHQYPSGNYVFFQDFYSGLYLYENFGEGYNYYALHYHQNSGDIFDNPESYVDTYCNIELSEGIFNIAPIVLIEGTGFCYNWRSYERLIVIVLPGHDISELDKASIAKMSTRQNAISATPIHKDNFQTSKRL